MIKITKGKTNKYSYVYLVESYRNKDKQPRQRIVKRLGILEEMQKENPNIIAELKEKYKDATKKQKINFEIDLEESNDKATTTLNYGYFFLDAIYKKLNIDKFIKDHVQKTKIRYDVNEIMKLLVYSRFLNPCSKLETFENQDKFFEKFDCKLENIYRSLDVFNDVKENLQKHIYKELKANFNVDTTLVFFDVTNYYFEINYDDELIIEEETGEILHEDFRKKGVSKENRKQPIVAMGLIIDRQGLPLGYKLFKGNTSDCRTLIPIIEEFKKFYKIEKIIVTADKGLNSGENLGFLVRNQDGYIVSQKIRGSKKEFIDKVLNQKGYQYMNKEKTYKSKSFIREREVIDNQGNTVDLKEKVLIFWSKDYADRAKHEREKIEARIQKYKENPSTFKASNSYGLKRYLKEKQVDKKTGEEIKTKLELEFDEEKYNRDVALDGYYAIITSEIELKNSEIIEKYRGLAKIEESFRIIKSDLEGRPVHVWKKEHIEAHFLICYVTLVISRILQIKTEYKISVEKLQKALNNATCKNIGKDIYSIEKQEKDFKIICENFNTSFDFANSTYENIRKLYTTILL